MSGSDNRARTRSKRRAPDPLRAAQRFWQLTDEELARLLRLAPHADRMELKLLVPSGAHQETYAALGLHFTRASGQRVYYLDTPDRQLHRRGVVARVRSIRGRPDDSVVKLRPIAPADIPTSLRQSKNCVVEIDGMPGAYVCSAALKSRLGSDDVAVAMSDDRPLHTLFSPRQRALLAPRLPRDVSIDDLTVFGPVDARRHKLALAGSDRILLAEQWTFPDKTRLLELSTRCLPGHALHTAAHTATLLRAHGVDLTGPQQTKTSATLKFFADATASARQPEKVTATRSRQGGP
jgi:hypothetical protein